MKLSLIIPLFNEEQNIVPLFEKLMNVPVLQDRPCEILLINDGSMDATAQKLDLLPPADNLRIIHLRKNFGQTAAIMAGFDHCSGDIIVTMDGDLQNDPRDIQVLLGELDRGYDVCSGWRKHRKDPFFTRIVPSVIANRIISCISGVSLRDYGCTLKAYRRDVLKDVHLYGEMHRFIPIFASWAGAKVTEIPVTHHAREHGKSKYGLMRTFKVILDLVVVKFLSSYSQKPIYLFGGFGLLNFLISFAGFGLMLYFKFFGQKSFIETPLPQLVVLFFLMGFMSILMGLIAEIQMRTYYEAQNKPIYLIKATRNLSSTTRPCVE